ncbi:MAG: glycosyltransferase [Marinilabiliales bacterium]|nr:MAG: glycosyltransferase [Marinilabiliales bacterium]
MKKQKKILICPLDWGLGHATRMVPVIDLLLEKGAHITIAADNGPLEFLKLRFPNCDFIKLKGFEAKYPKGKNMAFKMAMQFPAMIKAAKMAKIQLEEIIEKHKIDVVISDNRYELSTENAYSVFMTHQLNIQVKGIQSIFKPLINSIINGYIRKYNELWIPDFEGEENLSGILSHSVKPPIDNYFFIGPLSRFSTFELKKLPKKYDIMAILSGPEPQRSIFEKLLEKELLNSGLKCIMLSAKPNLNKQLNIKNILKVSHLPDNEFAQTIMESELIISRPGYSTIMDLAHFGKRAIFIPTPGQTEQEYLADTLKQKKHYFSQKQSDFDLTAALSENKSFKPIKLRTSNNILKERVDFLVNL